MRPLSFIPLLCGFLCTALFAEEKPAFEFAVGDRTIHIWMSDQDFDATKHEIELKAGAYGAKTLYIDGKHPVGTDNLIPKRSWKSFTVSWDGEEVPIPASLYENYYHPNLDANAVRDRNLTFSVDPNGEWVRVIMYGSDGGGAYLVGWELRRNGKHSVIDPSEFYRHPS